MRLPFYGNMARIPQERLATWILMTQPGDRRTSWITYILHLVRSDLVSCLDVLQWLVLDWGSICALPLRSSLWEKAGIVLSCNAIGKVVWHILPEMTLILFMVHLKDGRNLPSSYLGLFMIGMHRSMLYNETALLRNFHFSCLSGDRNTLGV